MKWPFFNQLHVAKGSPKNGTITAGKSVNTAAISTVPGKAKKSATRKRYRRARLLDLLCTVRHRARLNQAPSCCSSRLSDGVSSDELPMLLCAGAPIGPSADKMGTSIESLADLIHYHSLALRHPIPSMPTHSPVELGGRRRRSMLQEAACRTALAHRHFGKPNVTAATTRNSQSAFCPTCHNVVIFLPQKRRSCEQVIHKVDTERTYSSGPALPKRFRACLESYNPSYVPTTLGSPYLQDYPGIAVSEWGRGSFNPACKAVELEDETIYSVIADDSSTTDSCLPSVDNSSPIGSFTKRPKLVGTRRSVTYNGTSPATLNQWLLHRNNQPTTYESHSKSGGKAVADTGPTYDVIDPDVIEDAPVNREVFSASAHDEPFGDPCMSSTLKRGPKNAACCDQMTLYDEVASDTDDPIVVTPCEWSSVKVKLRSRRRRDHPYSPPPMHDPVKRVRREYFVCEE